MRKTISFFAILICLVSAFPLAFGENNDKWDSKPIITKAYEFSSGKYYVEWQGNAQLYQVNVDGKKDAFAYQNNIIVSLKKGNHKINILPASYERKDVDTKLDLNLSIPIINIGGELGIDLGTLGIDPKDLVLGKPSDALDLNYLEDPVFNAIPEGLTFETDFSNAVHLSFQDRYNSGKYRLAISKGKDTNYIIFDLSSNGSSRLIEKVNTTVSIILDQEYLQKNGCMVPELDEEYSFSVQLLKHPKDIISNEIVTSVILESKSSKSVKYTPFSAWKNPPAINYASQTADGQITLQWEHDDGGNGCEYEILSINKTLVVKTGEEIIGTTKSHEFVINDLMNGKATFAVRSTLNGEKGISSDAVEINIKNDWVIAPNLSCEQLSEGQVKLCWFAPESVDKYHITVYYGNSSSLLRFVDLDLKKQEEILINSESGNMEYIYSYTKNTDSEEGLKLKFEIYALRILANGEEQKSAISKRTLVVS